MNWIVNGTYFKLKSQVRADVHDSEDFAFC